MAISVDCDGLGIRIWDLRTQKRTRCSRTLHMLLCCVHCEAIDVYQEHTTKSRHQVFYYLIKIKIYRFSSIFVDGETESFHDRGRISLCTTARRVRVSYVSHISPLFLSCTTLFNPWHVILISQRWTHILADEVFTFILILYDFPWHMKTKRPFWISFKIQISPLDAFMKLI